MGRAGGRRRAAKRRRYGLHTSQSAALVIETLRAAIGAYGAPREILTDNGSQYVARDEPVPDRMQEARHRADRVESASAADAGQGGAVLRLALARVCRRGGVR
jgi:hypothetical protein